MLARRPDSPAMPVTELLSLCTHRGDPSSHPSPGIHAHGRLPFPFATVVVFENVLVVELAERDARIRVEVLDSLREGDLSSR